MAEIFLARLEAGHGFTKQVVIKRLLPHLCDDPVFVDMFRYEARLAAGLSHPNIAQVFDLGESEGRLHYAMEYVHGPDLREVAKRIHARGEPPPLDLVLGVCIGVAAGLHYAHTACDEAGRALKIVHRDVTPSNVVVTYGGVAKLLDFGVAKAQLAGKESTAVGVLKGKLPYMSPEQIDGTLALDGRSDVFSLGVMVWELTTLHRLYRCASQVETIRRITLEDAPSPADMRDDYPPALAAIVMRALARDREHRYASAFELQRALEEFALEHQLVVSPSRIAERMAELFADELEDERARLEQEPREVTDSEVFTTRWAGERGFASGDEVHDAPTRVSSVQPMQPALPIGATLATRVTAPDHQPRTRARGWPWFAGAAAAVVIVGLGWQAFELATASDPSTGSHVEDPAVEPASSAVVEDVARSEPVVTPTVESAIATPTPAEVPEPAPVKPSKRPAKRASASKSTDRSSANESSADSPSKSGWDKNSLALPE